MIKFIYGTMSAGKTVQLIKTYELLLKDNKNPIIIKPALDDREGKQLGWGTTKSKIADRIVPAFYYNNIIDALSEIKGTILVDEAQFMNKKDINMLITFARSANFDVLAYGLRTDVNGNLFKGSSVWLANVDEIKEIEKICEISGCNCKAIYHNRYINGKRCIDPTSILVEKDNITYKSVCYKHWKER